MEIDRTSGGSSSSSSSSSHGSERGKIAAKVNAHGVLTETLTIRVCFHIIGNMRV